VKAAVEDQEFVEVNALELHANRVTIHDPIQSQLILDDALETEIGFPTLVTILRERECLVADVYRGAKNLERIVHALKGHSGLPVKDYAPPAIVIDE
jgi:hypothetical protein